MAGDYQTAATAVVTVKLVTSAPTKIGEVEHPLGQPLGTANITGISAAEFKKLLAKGGVTIG